MLYVCVSAEQWHFASRVWFGFNSGHMRLYHLDQCTNTDTVCLLNHCWNSWSSSTTCCIKSLIKHVISLCTTVNTDNGTYYTVTQCRIVDMLNQCGIAEKNCVFISSQVVVVMCSFWKKIYTLPWHHYMCSHIPLYTHIYTLRTRANKLKLKISNDSNMTTEHTTTYKPACSHV